MSITVVLLNMSVEPVTHFFKKSSFYCHFLLVYAFLLNKSISFFKKDYDIHLDFGIYCVWFKSFSL